MEPSPHASWLGALTIGLCACGLFDDETPADVPSDTEGTVDACVDVWTATLEADLCPYPTAPMFTGNFEGGSVLWIDDPANATTVGPGGWLFGTTTVADWIGYLVEGDATCGIACVVPPGHPCANEGNQFCVGGLDEAQNPGCLYCGPATAQECESFVMNACPGDATPSSSGADVTGGSDPDGGADSTGGYADAPVPDTSMFTAHPHDSFGTTQYVLDRLGADAPPNLVAESLCDAWEPADAVTDWFGQPVVDRAALLDIVDRAELLLGDCDGLRLTMVEQGVELHGVGSGTLAAALGFREGDVLVSLDGVAATDLGGLMAEVIALSQQTFATASIVYLRDGATANETIRVQ